MRKNLLALSIAAMVGGLSGVANAQAVGTNTVGISDQLLFSNIKPAGSLKAPVLKGGAFDAAIHNAALPFAATQLTPTTTGVGHILFVPYFSTQGSNATLLSLVNTDVKNGKAVKLRFRGAANSDDLFDITIYLSPGDVWTANVSANGDISALSTNDNSCTLPSAQDIKDTGGKFKTHRVEGGSPAQTREGYVEILNTADVPQFGPDGKVTELFTAIKHVAGKAPCTQAVMDKQEFALLANDPVNDPVARGYSWPTGGLTANWILVNTADNASISGEASALRATYDNVIDTNGTANLVWAPQTTAPVDAAQAAKLSADPLLSTAAVRAAMYDFPDLSTPYTIMLNGAGAGVHRNRTPEEQAAELTDNLRTTSTTNEYATSAPFSTDWVFSMPTRRYAVALNYTTKAAVFNTALSAGTVPASYNADGTVASYARQFFTSGNTSVVPTATGLQICVDSTSAKAYDREEGVRTTFVISPDVLLRFCGETSVLTFNNATGKSVLGAKIATSNINTTFTDGWFRIDTPGPSKAGLPILGFTTLKAAGQSNFSGTWKHRVTK
ncbi:MAG: cell surface protein [Burkholderiaceae bacterium]|nr:cell surface protein [Burkholderiaceae bacterium]